MELRLLTELGRENFTNYLALTRRAITAELNNSPMKTVPSKVETASGQNGFENYLTQLLSQNPKLEQDRLYAAMAALDLANDKDACDSYKLILKATYDLGGLPGNWKRRDFANSLGE